MTDQPLIPVAQYLRMSTNHQQYSLANQRQALLEYATQHSMVVIQTYSDPGCSGLELKNRPGLRQLLQDVVASPHFRAIIVYDVSRWGRFQDPDEAAHYEFLCKSAGIPVHYCSEVFANDGSMANILLKQLKRTMAGEYSRELGVKVYAGQKNLIELGHKMGGGAGYGLRRCIVSPDGSRHILEQGQMKMISSDWIILVPGPASEVEVVRQIYSLAADRGMAPATIARLLNRRGIPRRGGKRWTHHTVTEILTNLKYSGVNVWGRTTQRLRSNAKPVPVQQWITKEHAFEAVIDPKLFDRVQKRLARRAEHRSNEVLLDDLRHIWKRYGKITQQLVATSNITPAPSTYSHRFGSLLKAYDLIGYRQERNCKSMIQQRFARNNLRDSLLCSFQQALPKRIRIVRMIRHRRPLLVIDDRILCAVILCPVITTPNSHTRWLARVRMAESDHLALVCTLDRENRHIARMFVSPPMGKQCWYTCTEHDEWFKRGIQIKTAAELCEALVMLSHRYPTPGEILIPKLLSPRPERLMITSGGGAWRLKKKAERAQAD
jgi:DNA invertase Pin-like site-specific DNA recombinase